MNRVRIGLVDDRIKLLSSLRENLNLYPDIEVTWTACNGLEAIDCLFQKRVDIILMDIEMPRMDGIEATRQIKARCPEVKIIMQTVFDDEDKIFEAILAGASGYLIKDEKAIRIYQSIMEAYEGGAPMSPAIAYKALQLITSLSGKPVISNKNYQNKKVEEEAESDLSEREMEILQKLAKGQSYNAIAEVLFISPKTVRNHIHNIYKKLQINSRYEAILLAQKNKWV